MAGSAVGVVSLAIVACQGLTAFIGDVKDAREKTSQASDQMDALTEQLERLQSIICKLDQSEHESRASAGIIACAAAIQRIRGKIGPGWEKSISTKLNFREQMEETKKRLLFPFKKEDLRHWTAVVESAQQNLQTALIALSL